MKLKICSPRSMSDLKEYLKEELRFLSEIGADFLIKSALPTEKSLSEPSFLALIEKIQNCQRCHLSQTRKHAVPGEGSFEAELVFVGEGPGFDEDAQGRPFVGKAGQLLTKIIKAMNFTRDQVYITNIVKCRPPNNRNPNKDEIQKCQDYLWGQLQLIDPKVIVSLGNVPTQFFLNTRSGISSVRGEFYRLDRVHIMPTFHPSYLIRNEGNRELKRMVWEDMKKVLAFLGRK